MAKKNTPQQADTCATCNGYGQITVHDYFTREEWTEACDACGGTGQS
jgi:DnaJ-class molecular chaperone